MGGCSAQVGHLKPQVDHLGLQLGILRQVGANLKPSWAKKRPKSTKCDDVAQKMRSKAPSAIEPGQQMYGKRALDLIVVLMLFCCQFCRFACCLHCFLLCLLLCFLLCPLLCLLLCCSVCLLCPLPCFCCSAVCLSACFVLCFVCCFAFCFVLCCAVWFALHCCLLCLPRFALFVGSCFLQCALVN